MAGKPGYTANGVKIGRPPKSHHAPKPAKLTPLKAGEIEAELEPVTDAASAILETVKLEPLTVEESAGWRKAAARVAEKYLQFWILPELIFTLLTTAIGLRKVKDKGPKAKIMVLVGGVGLFIALMVAKARLEGPAS